jgi:hypothetical protein
LNPDQIEHHCAQFQSETNLLEPHRDFRHPTEPCQAGRTVAMPMMHNRERIFRSGRSLRNLAPALTALAFVLVSTAGYAQTPKQPQQIQAALPQGFEPNHGQADQKVDFISHGPGYSLLLSAKEADLQLIAASAGPHAQIRKNTLRMKLLGANPRAYAEGRELQEGKSNYFIGNNHNSWRTDIPQYGRVEYREVYPGINVAYYGNNRQLEYDFIAGPQADPRKIRLAFHGADRIRIDESGDLILTVDFSEVRQRKPVVYQDTPSGRVRVNGRYVVRGRNRVGFEVAAYDRSKPLVIDPVLIFSSYFGGNGNDIGNGIKLDLAGNIYICGRTGSTNFPGNPIPGTPAGFLNGSTTAAYVAKISPSGALIFSSYVGGTDDQAFGASVAVDSNGNVYLAGTTTATDFPTLNPIQPTNHGSTDAFVLELNSGGSALVYSTYLGGSQVDYVSMMKVDGSGNAYVSGSTASPDFPTLNAVQPKYGGGGFDAYAAKISPNGSALVYSTFIGGSGTDFDNSAALDSSGNLYVFGDTDSVDFPVKNAFQAVSGGGVDGWIVKLDPTGSIVIYSTYIGGSGGDAVRGGQPDASGNLYITGNTSSPNFPILNGIQPTYGGGNGDAWVAALNATGSALIYSTYIGGNGDDQAYDLQLDALDNVYIVGETSSTNFPVVKAIQNSNAGAYDAFLTKINSTGSAILFSTYLGGAGTDYARQIAIDPASRVYIIGATSSSNFPTVAPLQGTFGGGPEDAFLAIIATCDFTFSPPSASFASSGGSGSVSINTTPECGWTAASSNPWITITSATSGTGSGSISYSVAPNTQGQQLTGSITIGDLTYSVVEFGGFVTLTSVNPNSGVQGTNVPVTLTGTNFAAGASVNVSGGGVTVSNVTVVSATQITATLGIASNATVGSDNVTVTSAAGTSNGVAFTVTSTAPVPVLSSISPNSGGAGNSVPVTLTGANFTVGAMLSSSNPSLSFSNVTVVSATQMTATFSMAANATPGSVSITVTTSNGTSNAVGFTIQPPFTPIRVDAGSSTPYTDPLGQLWSADTGFTGGSLYTVNHAINGTPVPVLYQTVHYNFNTPITYQTAVPNGYYTVNLKFEENQFTQSGKRVFNVFINGQEVLSNFDEFAAAGAQYQAVDVPIAVTVTNGSIAIEFVPVLSATGVYAIEILAGTPPAPTITSMTPNTGAIGATVPVTITGTNLDYDVVINAGPNITVNNITVVSATQLTATFNISATAPTGQANVKVTTPGGITAPLPFTIN